MMYRSILASLVLAQAFVGAAAAQGTCPPGMPPGVFCGERSTASALAGNYAADADHSSVIARVSHIGYTRPDDFRVQRSASIKAPPDRIVPLIQDFHAWGAWSP